MTSIAHDAVAVCVARVKFRARRHVLWLRHFWSSTPGALGLSISFEEVERLLGDEDDLARAEAEFLERDPAARALAASIDSADAAAATDPVLHRLAREFELEDADGYVLYFGRPV